jgi:hypothetical protein
VKGCEKMKKRFVLLVVAVLIFQILSATFVFATFDNQIQPMYLNTDNLSVSLLFSGKQGYVTCKVEGATGTTKIDATVTIYKKNFWGSWVETGNSWNYSVSDDNLSENETFTAESGKEYKAVLSANVLNGTWEAAEATAIKKCS